MHYDRSAERRVVISAGFYGIVSAFIKPVGEYLVDYSLLEPIGSGVRPAVNCYTEARRKVIGKASLSAVAAVVQCARRSFQYKAIPYEQWLFRSGELKAVQHTVAVLRNGNGVYKSFTVIYPNSQLDRCELRVQFIRNRKRQPELVARFYCTERGAVFTLSRIVVCCLHINLSAVL